MLSFHQHGNIEEMLDEIQRRDLSQVHIRSIHDGMPSYQDKENALKMTCTETSNSFN